MNIINIVKTHILKYNIEECKYTIFRIIASFAPIALVFLTRILLEKEHFNHYQTDYALILFGSLIFSFGIGVVSQIIGAQSPQLKSILLLLSFVVVVFILLINAIFSNLFVYVLPFSSKDQLVRYLWPTYIFITIFPNYYLGAKKYFYFFLPTILTSFSLIIGLFFFAILNQKHFLFFFFFSYNIYFIISNIFKFRKSDISLENFFTINELLRKQILPFYTGMIGIKNFQYYVIQIFGNTVFGDLKLLVTSFNSINFFISNKITVFSNNLLMNKSSKIPKYNYLSIVNYIIYLNIIFSSLFYFTALIFKEQLNYDFLSISLFCLFNIGFYISILNNQLFFATQISRVRIFGDFFTVGIILSFRIYLDFFEVKLIILNALIMIVICVWVAYVYNMFIKTKYRLYV